MSTLPAQAAPAADDVPPPAASTSGRAGRIAGWLVGGLPALMLLFGGVVDVLKVPFAMEGLAEAGYPEGVAVPLGVVTILSVVLYFLPRTAAVGAMLLTAYLGGAVSLHAQLGDPFYMMIPAVAFATLLWVGLILRDRRLRVVLPF